MCCLDQHRKEFLLNQVGRGLREDSKEFGVMQAAVVAINRLPGAEGKIFASTMKSIESANKSGASSASPDCVKSQAVIKSAPSAASSIAARPKTRQPRSRDQDPGQPSCPPSSACRAVVPGVPRILGLRPWFPDFWLVWRLRSADLIPA